MQLLPAIWRRWCWLNRGWHTWYRRLQRNRAGLALFVLLSLGVFEPVICIIHCEFWMPAMLDGQGHGLHQHHHQVAQATVQLHSDQSQMLMFRSIPLSNQVWCSLDMGSGDSIPVLAPASLLHDVVMVIVGNLALVFLLIASAYELMCAFLRIFLPPPLRPPILIAA